jgi:hypothetical protein
MIYMKRLSRIAQHYPFTILTFILILILQGCSGSNEDEINQTRLIVTLVDSPADYHEVNIDIQEISLKTDGTRLNDGWIELDKFNPGIYNILEFTGGQELPLADMTFPNGTISQIKLKLGKNNTLSTSNHTSNLLLANNYTDGYIFTVNEVINGRGTQYLRIDFDAAKSVSKLGSTGQLMLKPVIKLMSELNTGSISGQVNPAQKNVLVNVIANNRIIASSYAPENSSKFFVPGIEEGIYDLSFESSDDKFQEYIRDVKVTIGQVTDIGSFSIESDDDD